MVASLFPQPSYMCVRTPCASSRGTISRYLVCAYSRHRLCVVVPPHPLREKLGRKGVLFIRPLAAPGRKEEGPHHNNNVVVPVSGFIVFDLW